MKDKCTNGTKGMKEKNIKIRCECEREKNEIGIGNERGKNKRNLKGKRN